MGRPRARAGRRLSARQWADALNVTYVPAIVLFDAGNEVVRLEAMFRAFHVQSVLDYAASGVCRREPGLQRFLQQRADHLRESGAVVDLWE